jgi:hypothetical protein
MPINCYDIGQECYTNGRALLGAMWEQRDHDSENVRHVSATEVLIAGFLAAMAADLHHLKASLSDDPTEEAAEDQSKTGPDLRSLGSPTNPQPKDGGEVEA